MVLLTVLNTNSNATTYWVGDSPNCTGSNVFSSMPAALLAAQTSSNVADEIRLTATITYVGSLRGKLTISNYNSSTAGPLTIRGGYTDCFSATANSRSYMGDTDSSIISISPGAVSTDITLRNLDLVNGAFRGVVANGNVNVNANGTAEQQTSEARDVQETSATWSSVRIGN